MSTSSTFERPTSSSLLDRYDAVIVGAGFGGLRMLYELRQQGLTALVIDEADDVGGTWFWNRYPGARTDSEAWYYCYGFDPEITKEWVWTERFAAQPEVEAYLNFVADRHDLRQNILLGERVESAQFDDGDNEWTLTTESGIQVRSTFYVAAQGLLSASYVPDIEGIDGFEGEMLFAARWPKERSADFAGQRVAVIGTGATGVQLVPTIARTASSLTVLQRTPNFVIPSRNHSLDEVHRLELLRDTEQMWARTEKHPMALPYPGRAGRVAADLDPQDREALMQAAWERGTFRFLFELFDDAMTSQETNEIIADFVRAKIRAIVDDPTTAEMLCPKDHGVGSKRPPLGQHYYETFNRENVDLVDVKESAISAVTPKGIRLEDGRELEFDVIVFATGFDAVTGGFTRIDVKGNSGESLAERWQAGPQTFMSLAVDDFPNFFMILGPQGPYAILTVVIEHCVRFIGKAISRAHEGSGRIEVRRDAVEEWNQTVSEAVAPSLEVRGTQSWLFGANIPGKARVVQQYFGGFDRWLELTADESEKSYPHFTF